MTKTSTSTTYSLHFTFRRGNTQICTNQQLWTVKNIHVLTKYCLFQTMLLWERSSILHVLYSVCVQDLDPDTLWWNITCTCGILLLRLASPLCTRCMQLWRRHWAGWMCSSPNRRPGQNWRREITRILPLSCLLAAVCIQIQTHQCIYNILTLQQPWHQRLWS